MKVQVVAWTWAKFSIKEDVLYLKIFAYHLKAQQLGIIFWGECLQSKVIPLFKNFFWAVNYRFVSSISFKKNSSSRSRPHTKFWLIKSGDLNLFRFLGPPKCVHKMGLDWTQDAHKANGWHKLMIVTKYLHASLLSSRLNFKSFK